MLGEFADRPLPPDGRRCDHVDYHHGHVVVATGPQRRFDQRVGGSEADESPTNLFWQRFERIAKKVAI